MAGDIATAPHGQTALQPLAEVNFETGYAGLIAAFRAAAAARHIAIGSENVATVSGLPSNYVAKLLQPRPTKRIGAISLGPLLGVLGLKLVVLEDPEAVARFSSRIEQRNGSSVRTAATHQFSLSNRFLKKIGAEGGKARAKKLTPSQRSRSSRKAALARWAKRKQNGVHITSAGEIAS
jgi:hypothetical protein